MGGMTMPAMLAQILFSVGAFAAGNTGFCRLGHCINCMYCSGDCADKCMCFTQANTCCCNAPPGHFSRGYGAIPCIGGTYQDLEGAPMCKPCSNDNQLYDVNYRGALSAVDCEQSKCGCQTSECELQNCSKSDVIISRMQQRLS